MLSVQVFCPQAWDGPLRVGLKVLPRIGETFWLDFVEPSKGAIRGAFLVQDTVHVFTSNKGHQAWLILKPTDNVVLPGGD